MKNRKKIQLNKALYDDILRFFIEEKRTPEIELRIREGIDKDIEARIRREWYTLYKCAPTEAEREKARQLYLDAAGIPEDFRW